MEDRLVELHRLGEGRIRVERVPVAAEAIEERLVRRGLLFDHRVRLPVGRRVLLGARAAVTAPAARTADEGRDLVDGQQVAVLVEALDRRHDQSALALVVDVADARLVRELRVPRERSLQRQLLLAVEHPVEAVVQTRRGHAALAEVEDHVDGRDDAVGGEGLEAVLGHLVDEVELALAVLRGADAERVERQVTLGVARGLLGELVAERLVDVDPLVAALGLAALEVAHHRLHRLRDVLRVLGLLHAVDGVPAGLHVFGADVPADAEGLAGGALPAEPSEVTAADLVEAAARLAVLVGEPRDQR